MTTFERYFGKPLGSWHEGEMIWKDYGNYVKAGYLKINNSWKLITLKVYHASATVDQSGMGEE